MIEKRAAQRHRVLKGATIAFEGYGVTCTVRNLSSTGAGIDLSERIRLPSSFMLQIQRDHLVRRCRPVWHNDKRVGVAFE